MIPVVNKVILSLNNLAAPTRFSLFELAESFFVSRCRNRNRLRMNSLKRSISLSGKEFFPYKDTPQE